MKPCITLLLAGALAATGMAATAAETPPVQPTIVGGTDVPDGKYPFLVSLQQTGASSPLRGHFCGGTLISPSWVLTAAHCVVNTSPARLSIRIGETDLTAGSGANHAVATIHVHPAYTGDTNDVALVRLAAPVPTAIPIDLLGPDGAGYETPGKLLTVAGWGSLREGGDSPSRMQEVDVPFIATLTCQALYAGRFSVNAELEMCAGKAGKDSCQGDSGGPLFTAAPDGTLYQLGVVNWGLGCARAEFPGVYARLAAPAIDQFIETTWTRD